jgi:hypothetical protein
VRRKVALAAGLLVAVAAPGPANGTPIGYIDVAASDPHPRFVFVLVETAPGTIVPDAAPDASGRPVTAAGSGYICRAERVRRIGAVFRYRLTECEIRG